VGVDWPEDNKVIIVLEWLGVMLFIALAMNMVVFVYTVRNIFQMLAKLVRMCVKIAVLSARRYKTRKEKR